MGKINSPQPKFVHIANSKTIYTWVEVSNVFKMKTEADFKGGPHMYFHKAQC